MNTPIRHLLLGTLSLFLAGTHATAEENSSAVVTVDGHALTQTHFAVYRQQYGRQAERDSREGQIGLLNEIINTTVIAAEAERSGLAELPEIAAAIELARLRILAEAAVSHLYRQNPLSEETLQQAYKDNYAETRREYHARHILLEQASEAQAVIKALKEGADFAQLARERSKDASAESGGDLGWFELDVVVKPFADALAGMQPGGYTGTPVQTDFGWHVIRLEETREVKPPPFEDVRNALNTLIRSRQLATYLEGLREKAVIEFGEAPSKP